MFKENSYYGKKRVNVSFLDPNLFYKSFINNVYF